MGFVGELLSSNGLKLLFAMYSVETVSCRMNFLLLMAIKRVVSSHFRRDQCLYAVIFVSDDVLVENRFVFLIAIKLQEEKSEIAWVRASNYYYY